jgi:two-component sensor histidine kinase
MQKGLSSVWPARKPAYTGGTTSFVGEVARAVALTILPLLLFASAVVVVLGIQERSSVLEALGRRASTLATDIDRVLERQITSLTTLAGSHALAEGDLAHFYREAQHALAAHSEWITIVLSDPASGQQLINLLRPLGAPLPLAVDLASHEHTIRSGQAVAYADVSVRGPVSGRPVLGVRLPVLHEGRAKYVLSAVLKPEALTDAIRRLDLPPDWVGGIADAKGVIIARTHRAEETVGRPVIPEVLKRIASEESAILIVPDRVGVEAYAAFHRAPLSRWIAGLNVPVSDITALWFRKLWIIGLGGLISAATAMGAITWLTQRRRAAHQLLEALVSERTAALERALAERNVLLREVHHRVKNNLQMMASMIRIAARDARDPALVFRDITRRITTIGQAYNQVSAADNLISVDLATYLQDVCNNAMSAQAGDAIRSQLRLEPMTADIDTALPLGLIVSELITNALKHAFPAERAGEVLVRLERRGDHAVLTVRDNGVGIGPELRASALGLKLIEALASQLDGHLRAKNRTDGGAQFRLVFNPCRQKGAPRSKRHEAVAVVPE